MRFHIPALPGQPVTKANSTCAYTQKIFKFVEMMVPRGHEVFIYGSTGDACDCGPTEFVEAYPTTDPIEFDPKAWAKFNFKAAAEISERQEDGDFLLISSGLSQEVLATSFQNSPMRVVEYGIGYGGVFCPFKVFESYAWMHTVYGSQAGSNPHNASGNYYDTVIPNYFNVKDFAPKAKKQKSLLYLGRLIDRKGIGVASQVAEETGHKIKFAGEGPDGANLKGEMLGKVGPAKRKTLLANAKALIVPTQYVEPFGGVVIEAMLSGTPVITTDWGAFTETVIPGFNGFRCRTLGEFKWAVENIELCSPSQVLAAHAKKNYSLEATAPKYETYFEQVDGLYGSGNDWNSDWEGLSSFESDGFSRYGVAK